MAAGQPGSALKPWPNVVQHTQHSVCAGTRAPQRARGTDICFSPAGFEILLLFVFWQNKRLRGSSRALISLIYLLPLNA